MEQNTTVDTTVDTRKTIFYKVYKAWKEQGSVCDLASMVKLHIKTTDEEINEWKSQIDWIDKCIELDDSWKFGTELEYGGTSNRLSYNAEDEEEIIETIKHDCSVAGDGTEYNLKPQEFGKEGLNRKLESFCYRAANKNCTESTTAGEHFHYSWGKVNRLFGGFLQMAMSRQRYSWITEGQLETIKEVTENDYVDELIEEVEGEGIRIKTFKQIDIPYTETQRLKWGDEEIEERGNTLGYSKEEIERTKSISEALKVLYSTSNRTGNENYGLGSDGTRGFTRHETIELRCWRTTLDYRSIIARAHVGRFVLRWIIKYIMLDMLGFTKEEKQDIWKDLWKEDYVYNCFKYLAFHESNPHCVAYTQEELEVLTGTAHTTVLAIKARTKMYKRALKKKSAESNAKELINMI